MSHRAKLQMDMDFQWDTSQTSESLLWISSWCGKASSELSDGKVQVTRRPTTTARGDFFNCITDDACLAALGVVIANNASTLRCTTLHAISLYIVVHHPEFCTNGWITVGHLGTAGKCWKMAWLSNIEVDTTFILSAHDMTIQYHL